MPWKELSPKMHKVEFLAEWRKKDESMAELCRQFGISRKTGYKLIARWREEEEGALIEHSRAPLSHPNATPDPVRQAILGLLAPRMRLSVISTATASSTPPTPQLSPI